MDKKEAESEALRKTKEAQHAAGKINGMSGRDLVSLGLGFDDFVDLGSVPIQPRVVRRSRRGRWVRRL